ncbi:hypothetical protein, partial [uncultured Treponema sp.]|uniref:hypothetical protein n=1 Tax=uncultured Treponema sp. TaxID=162155 RepID=UPI00280B6881
DLVLRRKGSSPFSRKTFSCFSLLKSLLILVFLFLISMPNFKMRFLREGLEHRPRRSKKRPVSAGCFLEWSESASAQSLTRRGTPNKKNLEKSASFLFKKN